jgi:hypothetical protein
MAVACEAYQSPDRSCFHIHFSAESTNDLAGIDVFWNYPRKPAVDRYRPGMLAARERIRLLAALAVQACGCLKELAATLAVRE